MGMRARRRLRLSVGASFSPQTTGSDWIRPFWMRVIGSLSFIRLKGLAAESGKKLDVPVGPVQTFRTQCAAERPRNTLAFSLKSFTFNSTKCTGTRLKA